MPTRLSFFFFFGCDCVEMIIRYGLKNFWSRVMLSRAQRQWANLPFVVDTGEEKLSTCKTSDLVSENYDIVLPVFGAIDDVTNLLEILALDRPRNAGAIVLVDDASHSPALSKLMNDFVAKNQKNQMIVHGKNLGFARSVTTALTKCENDLAVVINTDAMPPLGALDRLMNHFESRPDLATICPLSNCAAFANLGPADRIRNMTPEEVFTTDRQLSWRFPTSYLVPFSSGFCWGIRRSVFDSIGGFSEEFFGGYGEESDFCLRAWQAGYTCAVAANTAVYHKGGASFGARKALRLTRLHSAALTKKHRNFLTMTKDRGLIRDALVARGGSCGDG